MSFRVELLGDFKLIDLETGHSVPLRSYTNIIALLVFNQLHLVARKDVLKRVWADEDEQSARNRLRVALVRLRIILGNALIESHGNIGLNPAECSADIWDAEDMIQSFYDSVDVEMQLKYLRELTESFEWEKADRWAAMGQGFFKRVDQSVRSGLELAVRSSRFDDALRLALFGLKLHPEDQKLLYASLQAGVELGRGSEIAELLEPHLGKARQDSQIKEILSQIRRGDSRHSGLATLNRQFMVQFLEVGVESHPELIRKLLSQPETLPLAGANPREMLLLLERVVNDVGEKDEAWERCSARMIGLRAWLNDAAGVLRDAPALLESSKNPMVLRATWNYVSIAHSLLRDWTGALSALEKTSDYAVATGDVIDIASVLGTKALYLMHQGKYEEAKRMFRLSFELLDDNEFPRAKLDYAIGFGNRCMLPVFEGDWKAGEEELQAGISIRSALDPPAQHGLLKAALAVCFANLGKVSEVHALIQQALREAFEGESVRDQIITFEFSACTLAALGDSEFAGALDRWIVDWREQTGLPRSHAEKELCAENQLSDHKKSLTFLPQESPARVGQEIVRRLRKRLM